MISIDPTLAVQHINPPIGFYETSVTVIATLYVALAIELRLLRPHPDAKLPEDPTERRNAVRQILLALVFPLASIVGFWSAVVAIYQGGNATLGTLTLMGVAAATVTFFMTSLSVFFRMLGELVPPRFRRRPLLLGLGFALMLAGSLLFVLS